MPSSKPIDILPDQVATRTCNKCGEEKPLDKFSLSKGAHSAARKYFCVACEHQMRKARNKYDLTLEEMRELLRRPCVLCGQKSEVLDVDKRKRINGSMCRRCFKLVQFSDKTEQELLLRAHNYVIMRLQFPFLLRMLLQMPEPDKATLLLDWIEQHGH